MSRLIDADALKEDIKQQCALLRLMKDNDELTQISVVLESGFMAQIDKMPTIEERKTGRWIHVGTWTDPYTADEEPVCQCSVCGQEVIGYGTSNFCSECGARMER